MMDFAIYHGPTRTLELSTTDMLWAARGCLGEGGNCETPDVLRGYLWSVMRRCLLMNSSLSYGAMWRAFSQPINPRWRRGVEFCRVGGKYRGTDACSDARLDRRERLSSLPWASIPATVREGVKAFAAGALAPPVVELSLPAGRNRLSNWASYPGVKAKFPHGVEIAGEWFLEDEGLRPGEVTVTAGTRPIVEPQEDDTRPF